jgi:hypothetical protein
MPIAVHPARPFELPDDDEAIFACAVVAREPDADVADGDLAWWLSRQEQAETRVALAARGLL